MKKIAIILIILYLGALTILLYLGFKLLLSPVGISVAIVFTLLPSIIFIYLSPDTEKYPAILKFLLFGLIHVIIVRAIMLHIFTSLGNAYSIIIGILGFLFLSIMRLYAKGIWDNKES